MDCVVQADPTLRAFHQVKLRDKPIFRRRSLIYLFKVPRTLKIAGRESEVIDENVFVRNMNGISMWGKDGVMCGVVCICVRLRP